MAKPARKIFTKIIKDKFQGKANQVLEAVETMVDFIKVTLGPKTRHILVDFGYKTELMDDGRSIASEFELEDEFQDAVVSYVKEATKKQDDKAGDGTTTTMILLASLLRGMIESGKTYPEIRREFSVAVASAVEQIKKRAKIVESEEELVKVAMTSFNDLEVAKILAQVVWAAGPKGAVSITDYTGRGVEFEKTEGFVFGRGMKARGMITNREKQAWEGPNKNFGGQVGIYVTEALISKSDEIAPILQQAEDAGHKNIAIFCPNLIGEAMGVVAMAQMKGYLNILAVQLPGEGDKARDFVQDICTVTGAVADKTLGLADRVISTLDDTTIVGGQGDKGAITELIAYLQAKSEESKDDYDKEYYHLRQARLQGGVVMIKVGGVTETETRLKIKKVEDAVNSCRCALEDGIVPGGAVTLAKIKTESDILNAALQEPLETLCENSEIDGEIDVATDNVTFDALTGQVGDYLEIGVVDSAKVLMSAIENATSIASILFSVSGIITSKRETNADNQKS